MHAAAQAQPNIALIKYWGKRDTALNLPAVGSISITLDSLWTRTQLTFEQNAGQDELTLNGVEDPQQTQRVSRFLDLFRARAGVSHRARIVSENNFPTSAGLASSASGFAALAVAANHALGLDLKPGELSEFARRGSGSAARSIFGGYVEMAHGDKQDGSDAVATPLLDSGEWPLSVLVAITSTAKKAIASTEGMENTSVTSPYYPAWVDTSGADLEVARRAIADKDFDKLADVSEFSCLKMHGSALAAQPGLLYWNGATVDCLNAVRAMRANGVPVFFTVDAGPQVKAVCEPAYRDRVADSLRAVSGVQDVLATELGEGARLIGDSQ